MFKFKKKWHRPKLIIIHLKLRYNIIILIFVKLTSAKFKNKYKNYLILFIIWLFFFLHYPIVVLFAFSIPYKLVVWLLLTPFTAKFWMLHVFIDSLFCSTLVGVMTHASTYQTKHSSGPFLYENIAVHVEAIIGSFYNHSLVICSYRRNMCVLIWCLFGNFYMLIFRDRVIFFFYH